MKGKIAGIDTYENKTHIRIKVDKTTQKNYNKFRQELIDKFKVTKRGYGGYTEIIGENIDINIFKREDYVHLVVYTNKKIRGEILKILLEYFKFIK
jgi:hypothetical protein